MQEEAAALCPSALTVKPEWLSLILSGCKTWELRSKPCRKDPKAFVALLASGTSTVWGFCQIDGSSSRWRSLRQLRSASARSKHQVSEAELQSLTDLRKAGQVRPLGVSRLSGSVSWLRLEASALEELELRQSYEGSACLQAALRREMRLARQRRPRRDAMDPRLAPRDAAPMPKAPTESLRARLIRKARSFYGKSLIQRAQRIAKAAEEATKAAPLSQRTFESSLAWHLFAPKEGAEASSELVRRLLRGILALPSSLSPEMRLEARSLLELDPADPELLPDRKSVV